METVTPNSCSMVRRISSATCTPLAKESTLPVKSTQLSSMLKGSTRSEYRR